MSNALEQFRGVISNSLKICCRVSSGIGHPLRSSLGSICLAILKIHKKMFFGGFPEPLTMCQRVLNILWSSHQMILESLYRKQTNWQFLFSVDGF
jgi:hypothetical protein